MGTSIDNHIEILKSYHNGFTGQAGNLQDSIDVAVDIMEKYQRIQEIHKKWFCDYTSAEAYTKISEVLKDGKID